MPALHLCLFPGLRNVAPTAEPESNHYQGDEDVLGSECADLGLNGWSGLNDQGLLMFKGSFGVKMAWKLAAAQRLAHTPRPQFGFQFTFISKASSPGATGLLITVFGDVSLTLEDPPVMY